MKYIHKLNYKWFLLFLCSFMATTEAAEVVQFDAGWNFTWEVREKKLYLSVITIPPGVRSIYLTTGA
ncbi:MAG: hypothetical protein LUD46_14290 [Parabacteroides sp.]|nr:hypothetical protein [Parabacteroides sp.]